MREHCLSTGVVVTHLPGPTPEQRMDPSPLVTHRLPLSRFDEAVDLVRAHRALKVLLVPESAVPESAVPEGDAGRAPS